MFSSSAAHTSIQQALQQVEWCWLATVQLVTQLAAALAYWGEGPAGSILWLSLTVKALVVGVVYMQRLDDRRIVSRLASAFWNERRLQRWFAARSIQGSNSDTVYLHVFRNTTRKYIRIAR